MERQQRQRWLISIHAPPRGATPPLALARATRSYFNSRPSARGDSCRSYCGFWASNFNSRPSARGDGNKRSKCLIRKRFQFTPLREGRPRCRITFPSTLNFNSRPSARGDAYQHGSVGHGTISIHAPPRGATGDVGGVIQHPLISIHAPPRGATAKDMQFLQIFCSTLTNQHGLTIVPGNLSRLFW